MLGRAMMTAGEKERNDGKVGIQIVRFTTDHEATRFLILSFREPWQRSHAKCSPNGLRADSMILVERSGLASQARYAEARAQALVNFFWSVKSHHGVGA